MQNIQGFKNITMGDMLEETARKFPTHKAVKYIEMEFDKTWYEFNNKVDRVAKGLMGMGLKKGDHAAVWATNYPQWLILMFATAKIGVVLVTVNTNYKSHELKFQLEQSDSKALFVCDGLKDIDCEKIIYSICPELGDKDFNKRDALFSEKPVFEAYPKLRMVVSFDNHYRGMFHWNDIESFKGLVSSGDYKARKASLSPDDVINMQYTSGTTGFPKGVMLTHNNIVNNGFSIGECMKFTENDKLCIPVPFFHCFGMVLAIMACVTHGSTMLPLLWYTPMKVMHVVEYERCTAVHGVPTMFIGILEHRDFDKYDYSTLRTGIMAGSPCPVKVMEDVLNKMNMKEICITYGQTEASPAITMSSTTDSVDTRVSTVGSPMPGVEVKIVDPETGKDLPDNAPGELCARGYNIMKGYYKMPEATEAAIDEDGWLHTGDVAIRIPDGNYKITGRIKDMIIRGGENLFPKEIEDFIYTHPAVKDVAVVAVPSVKHGEEVCAFVILKDNAVADEAGIKAYVNENLARHKVPSYVLFVDSFPLTASGKIQKYKMRENAVSELGL
ncbi:MAG: AMP-binding protein [Oscillospiraceae bacterium]|nr:AMP-binding protein [Oscillospiraceae bacterium]